MNLQLSNQDYSNAIGAWIDRNVVKNPFINPVGAIADKGKSAKNITNKAIVQIKEEDKRNKEIVKHGGIVKLFVHWTSKFNPAAAIPRAGVLAGMRVNIFGLSTRLYPAFLSDAELKKGKFNIANAANARKAWQDVKTFYYNLGGDPSSLEKAIKQGHKQPVFKTKKSEERKRQEAGFDGYSNVTGYDDAAIIVAGIGLIGSMAKMVSDSKAAKNPYDGKQIDTSGMDSDLPILTAEQLASIQAAANSDRALGLGLDAGREYILGMPSGYFWGGVSVLTIASVIVGVKLYKKYKINK